MDWLGMETKSTVNAHGHVFKNWKEATNNKKETKLLNLSLYVNTVYIYAQVHTARLTGLAVACECVWQAQGKNAPLFELSVDEWSPIAATKNHVVHGRSGQHGRQPSFFKLGCLPTQYLRYIIVVRT